MQLVRNKLSEVVNLRNINVIGWASKESAVLLLRENENKFSLCVTAVSDDQKLGLILTKFATQI